MKLRELFEKDIDRNINGVVKVEQVDDETIVEQELEEFVVTNELLRHFRTFYNNYNNSLDERTDKVGVWISGFFGSGKSHFLKMLSYLLENKDIKGKRTVDYFENKFGDSGIFLDIKRSVNVPTECILFNIDSKSAVDAKIKETGIVDVFLRVFNEKLGYSANYPRLANIERHLDKIGKYQEYKNLVESKTGLTWNEAIDTVEFYKDSFIEAYVELTESSTNSAQELFANIVEDYSITPENFAKLIKEYLESKGQRNRLIFLVDEIGQFISDNTNLMLNLQTVVENLGTICNGRAWVMVTSQEAIDAITKEKFRDQDFSKIQGRFDTKLSLSGSNTDEVIKKRLLAKTTPAKQVLQQHYNEQEKILSNLITFSGQTSGMKVYEKDMDFVDCYPFVPYQFKLLQSVFASLRNFSHAGAHLSQNERSMLNAFHNALKDYGDKDVTELVPFNVFYQTIRTFIDTDIVRIIDQAREGNDLDDFDIEVLVVLFLIKYIKDVPCDIENLATLMISNINESKNNLKSKIEGALTRLKRATLIQQNGDIYDFLTNEEQDVSRGIKNTPIDQSDVLGEVYRNIYEEIFTSRSITPIPNHTYLINRRVDDIARGTQVEDIEIKFITSMNPDHKWSDNDLKLKFMAENTLFIKLKDNGYLGELETILKTEKYTKQKNGVKQTEIQAMILTNKGGEILDRKKRVKTLIEQAIMESTFFTAGNVLEVSATSAAAKIENAMKVVVENTYTNLHFIKEHVKDEKEIVAKLTATQVKLTNANEMAMKDLSSHLQLNSQMNYAVTMQALKNKYTKKPYGWSLLDIAGLVADLISKNEVKIIYNGVAVQQNDTSLVRYLTNERELVNSEVKVKKQIDAAKVQQVTMLIKELFGTQNLNDDGEKLATQIKEELISELLSEISVLKGQHNNPMYPNKSVIEAGEMIFRDLKTQPDATVLLDTLISMSDRLKEWYSSYRLLKSFFNSQKGIFDEALEICKLVKDNEIYMEIFKGPKMDELRDLYKKISAIVELESPYSEIKNLPPLTSNLKGVFKEALDEFKYGEKQCTEIRYAEITKEAQNLNLDANLYIDMYNNEIVNRIDSINDFGQMNALTNRGYNYYLELLKKMTSDALEKARAEQPVETTEEQCAEPIAQPIVKELDFVNPVKLVQANQILETEEDVDNYVGRLAEELKSRIRANKRIKLQ